MCLRGKRQQLTREIMKKNVENELSLLTVGEIRDYRASLRGKPLRFSSANAVIEGNACETVLFAKFNNNSRPIWVTFALRPAQIPLTPRDARAGQCD